jgi:hypothetical protein
MRLPDQIRIEVESSIGQTLALFACDGRTLYHAERGSETPTVEPASIEGIERTLGFPLQPGEILSSLLGRIEPLSVQVGHVVPRSGDVVFLDDGGNKARVQIGFDPAGGVLRSRTYFDASGSRRVVVRYLAFTAVGGQVIPSRLQIRDVLTKDTVEITVTRLTLNPELRPEIFAPGPVDHLGP